MRLRNGRRRYLPERNFRDPQEMFAFTPRIRDMAQLTVHDSAGFPRILWEVLQGAGYATPPQYAVQQFEKHRVPRCRVRMTLEPHPLQPGWRSLDSEYFGYRAEDTIEAIALHGLTTFCGFHPLELATHPIGLFPAEREDDHVVNK